MRRSLRNGSLWSPYGDEFSDPARNLMPLNVWQKEGYGYCFRKNLPTTAEAYTDQIQAAIRAALAGLQEAAASDAVYIGRNGFYYPRGDAENYRKGSSLRKFTYTEKSGGSSCRRCCSSWTRRCISAGSC